MISIGNVTEFELAVTMFELFTGYEVIIDENPKAMGFNITCYNSPSYGSYEGFISYQNHLADYCDALMDSFFDRYKENKL